MLKTPPDYKNHAPGAAWGRVGGNKSVPTVRLDKRKNFNMYVVNGWTEEQIFQTLQHVATNLS